MVGSFYSTYAPIFREEDKLTHFINPTNYIYAVGKYAKQRLVIKEHLVVEPIGLTPARRRLRCSDRRNRCWCSWSARPPVPTISR